MIFAVNVPASCAGKGYHLHHHHPEEASLLLRNLDCSLICLCVIRGPFFLCLLQTKNKSLAGYDVLETTSYFFSLKSAFAQGESAAGSHPSMTTTHLPSWCQHPKQAFLAVGSLVGEDMVGRNTMVSFLREHKQWKLIHNFVQVQSSKDRGVQIVRLANRNLKLGKCLDLFCFLVLSGFIKGTFSFSFSVGRSWASSSNPVLHLCLGPSSSCFLQFFTRGINESCFSSLCLE